MHGLTRRWLFRTEAQDAGLPLVPRVLAARGLEDGDRVRRFCDPRLTDLHEPHLMPGVDAAADRIARALRGGERIVIYCDYDVDGIAACAILWHVLKSLAPDADVRTYVPHRLEEGYGLNAEALELLRREGANLVVTVDCGITAAGAAATARRVGLDLVVTDHHCPPPPDALPDADALVHPGLEGSGYPFPDLCGAGVAFKLAWGLAVHWCGSRRVAKSVQKVLLEMLPLAALGTIADVVPLVDENRTIASWGLRWIRQTPNTGLRALIEASDLAGDEIDSEKVGFILAPRLNACGRMGHAAEAVHLLTGAGHDEAQQIARRLTRLNRERQQTERAIAEHAARLAEDAGMTGPGHRAIVLADESWHAGVVGIVCSRLVERFCRPVVLLHDKLGVCKGSARSIEGYSIHDALAANAEHLDSFGGHDAAAGLTLPRANLEAFTAGLVEHANARIGPEQLTPSLWIDCDAGLGELDIDAVQRIAALSPFGRDNPRPTLRLTGLSVAGPPRQVGGNGRHLTVSFRAESGNGSAPQWLRAIWFGAGERAADLSPGMHVEAVIEPKINEWNGRVSVEGVLADLRIV